uniref:RTX toxins and related Ca2+-binding proteins-like protein n=1 Tax=Rhodopseudomonas palustris (strain BisA53) TaxID=316055 RepID=Q07SW9_RHOP5
MITVKATRSSQQGAETTREDFVVEEQNKRRWVPLAFLLFLTACAAFLKSFMPVGLEAHEEPQKPRGHEDEAGARTPDDAIVAEGEDDDLTTGAIGSKPKSSDNVAPVRIGLSGDGAASAAPGSPGDVKGPPSPVIQINSAPIGDPVRAGNDNGPERSSNAGGGSGGGGGGGGGGRDEPPIRPRPNSPTGTNDGSAGNPGSDGLRNRAPRINAPVYLPNVVGCEALTISLLLLAGASDPDGDSLRVIGLSSSSGTLTQAEDGGWIFTRDQGMLGNVTLTYAISDGQQSIQQVAYFSVVEAPPIIGTVGDDNLLGTHCADTIDGSAGDDNIDAREGDDVIFGGIGNDTIIAGSGSDIVYAGPGNDIVFAGAGNDIVFGGSGNDRLFGEDGNDSLFGEDGDDQLFGGAGNDVLMGGIGNDLLSGGLGDDVLSDGEGSDTVRGDEGDDYVVAAADGAPDDLSGGDGLDTLDYSAARLSIHVNFAEGTAEGEEIGNDSVEGFEAIIGGSGNDKLTAGLESVSMHGGAGDDLISDGSGADTVDAGDDDDCVVAAMDGTDDRYSGGSGRDTLDYSSATLSITVDLGEGSAEGIEIGRDLLAEFEEIIGGDGNDHFIGGSNSVAFTGGGGDDTFEFQRRDDDHQPDLIRKITDFTVGDRIVTATYQIYYLDEDDAADEVADLFDDIYLANEGDRRPVRFRFEQQDECDVTLIDVHDRPDNDQDFYSIQLSGHHQLQFTVAVS